MKTNISVCIDVELCAEIRKRNINISSYLNECLKELCQLPKETEDKDPILKIAHLKARLAEAEKEKAKIDSKEAKKITIKCGE